MKLKVIRTNDEGTLIYHSELMGNGTTYPKTTKLTPTYVSHNII